MSVRQGLLALLLDGPSTPAALRSGFELRTGGTWPINPGQVATTLARLERDGLVRTDGEDGGRTRVTITAAGESAVRAWFSDPVERDTPGRDELAIKIALAVTTPGVDVDAILTAQRTATLRAMQGYARLAQRAGTDPGELPWLLVLDSLVFAAEAEVRWLDHCEIRLARSLRDRPPAAGHPLVTEPERITDSLAQRTGGAR